MSFVLSSRVEDAIIGLENEACGFVRELALGKMLPNITPDGKTGFVSFMLSQNLFNQLNYRSNRLSLIIGTCPTVEWWCNG